MSTDDAVVSAGAATACGLKHGKNQDRYVCDARSAFFGRFCAVFDGHGGEAAAELAAERLLAFAEARAADADGNADALGGALARAFADCEHALARAAAAQRSDPGGAVAVAAAVLPSAPPTLLLAWAGDATALLLRRGHAVRLTREHTLAEPSELRRVLLSGGEVVPPRTPADAARVVRRDANDLEHRVVPTRGIGDLQDGQPNTVLTPLPVVRTLWLSAGDELLALVSDGVTGVLTDQEIVAAAASAAPDGPKAASAVVAAAQRALATDDCTAVVVFLACSA